MKSVVIFGAGIAGLSTSHYLAKRNYKVTVFESLPTSGGLARSEREQSDNMPTEYSYRGMGPWYHNMFSVMREIPTQNGDTVYDTELSRPVHWLLAHDRPTDNHLQVRRNLYDDLRLTWKDRAFLLYLFAKAWCACDLRSRHEYSRVNTYQLLSQYLSPDAAYTTSQLFGPWIGTDSARASLHHSAAFFRKNVQTGAPAPHYHKGPVAFTQGSGDGWLFFMRPSNEAWFDPWVKYLKSIGVDFYFNQSLRRLDFDGQSERFASKITGAEVISLVSGQVYTVTADYYVLAINPYETDTILKRNPQLMNSDQQLQKFDRLTQDPPHVQISFRVAFGEKLKMTDSLSKITTPPPAIILVDSEYNLTFFPPDELWYPDVDLGDGVKSLWSGTATVDQRRGPLYSLPLTRLTKQQFQDEIIFQMYHCQELVDLVAKYNNGRKLQEVPIKKIEVWKSWKFPEPNKGSGRDGHANAHDQIKVVTNDEKKWVNNTNNTPWQPKSKTSIINLYLAGAHTQTDADLYSMEAAVESGRRVADEISGQSTVIPQQMPMFLRPFQSVDEILYQLNLPNIVDLLLAIIMIVGLFFFGNMIYQWVFRDVLKRKIWGTRNSLFSFAF